MPGRVAVTVSIATPRRFVLADLLIPGPVTRMRSLAMPRPFALTKMRSVVRLPTTIVRRPTVTESQTASGGWNGATMRVVSEVVLFSGRGSGWSPVTRAVLRTTPGVFALATTFTTAFEPSVSPPRRHVTVRPAVEQRPWFARTETIARSVGRVSVTTIPVALPGPLFVTVIV
jgi:hypothetical protein